MDCSGLFVFEVLVRSRLYVAADQVPQFVLVSGEGVVVGGNVSRFAHERIPLGAIIDVGVVGRSVFRCVRVEYESEGVQRQLYLTPFSGEVGCPLVEAGAVDEFCESISECLAAVGVRL